MKKTIFLVFMLMLSLTNFAQQTHLKFMGIELNGSITEFQTKLQAKGIAVSPKTNQYPTGMRLYDGVFSGKDAQIIVWYNPRSKQVYRAKAILSRYGKDLIEQLQKEMEGKLDLKYGTSNKYSELVKDDHLQEFMQYKYVTDEGSINLFIVSTGYSSQNDFYLQIDYIDKVNSSLNTLDEMDDL